MLVVAALVQLVLGLVLFVLGRWGRLSADALVPTHLHRDDARKRADALARAALFGQGIGLVLVLFAVGTAVAAATGLEVTLRPE